MENNKAKKISIVALITSILPLLTLIPVFLGITLPNYLRYSWTGFNMISVLLSFILSIIGVCCNKERWHIINITIWISSFWMLMVIGIITIALISNIPAVGL